MKRQILMLLPLLLCLMLEAKPIPPQQAEQVAKNFGILKSGRALQPLLVDEAKSSEGSLFYIFNLASYNGFVIIAGDDAATPILGYSTELAFETENLSPSFQKWMEWYKRQIREIREQNLQADSAIAAQWNYYLTPKVAHPVLHAGKSPLLTTKWNQGAYYDAMCPYDNTYNQRTVTGCVATAMAQIMKYWDYPAQGVGNHSYSHEKYGTLSANFGATTYNWGNMPNTVNSSNNSVATLMYHVGVSVNMNYNVGSQGGSGAYVINSRSPVQHCSEYAFKTYFNYDPALEGKARENFGQSTWIQMLKTELDADRPVLYAGFGQGGHAFVCDGYDDNDYFHFNWGWGGMYDGYFLINSLNPGTGGAGAGAGTYNNGQQAIFGVKPASGGGGGGGGGGSTPSTIVLYSSIQINPNPINYLGAFSVSADIVNLGNQNLNGSFAAAIFTEQGEFVDYVQIGNSLTLPPAYYTSRTFTSQGMTAMLPGTYIVGIYYREGTGNWVAVGNGNYNNFISFNVYEQQGNIRLYAALQANPNPVVQGANCTVNFNIANFNQSYAFNGLFSVDLHKSDGTWIKELGRTNAVTLNANSYFSQGLSITINNLNEEPGSYRLQLWYMPNGGDWNLVSSGTYANPIPLQIISSDLNPDVFEVNNTSATSYKLPVVFMSNNASIKTVGSSIHSGTDLDYYKFDLEPGYSYSISARLHDAFSATNGFDYTCDVTVAYSFDGSKWSESFDDVIPAFNLPGGGTVYFAISPYFTGQKGTYLLDANVQRINTSGLTEGSMGLLSAFPNPVKNGNEVTIQWTGGLIQSFEIMDAKGARIQVSSEMTTDTLRLEAPSTKGVYFIRVNGYAATETIKLVVE